MNRILLTLIRECLHSNTIFHRILLTYSLILVVLGGQLPGVYYLLTLVLGSIAFFIWFGNYSRWNHSQEYLSTLPGYNQYVDKAKWLGGILLTLPFYGITLFSAIRQLNGNHGMYETISQFTTKSLLFLALYFIVYRLISGKRPKIKSTVFLRNIRYVFGALTLIPIAILVMAYAKNLSFYDSIQSIENPQRLIPARAENPKDYTCENPDKLLINLFVTENYSDQQVTYSNHKIIDYPQDGLFELNLGEFPEAPARFRKIFLESDGKKVQISNLNDHLKDENAYPSHSNNYTFESKRITDVRLWSNDRQTDFVDPWYRRLFAVNPISIRQYHTIEAHFIPYNSLEDELIRVPLTRNYGLNPTGFLQSRYNTKMRNKISPITEQRPQVIVHKPTGQSRRARKVWTRGPANLLTSLPLFYLLVLIALFLGFFFVQFKPIGLFVHTLLILALFTGIDFGLMKNRMETSLNQNQLPVIRITAAIDLNQTIFWREYTAKQLQKSLPKLTKEPYGFIHSHLFITRLMLWNQPNPLLGSVQGERQYNFFYQNNHSPDLYARFLEQSVIVNLGKLISEPGIYLPFEGQFPLLKLEEHELMNMKIIQETPGSLNNKKYSHFKEVRQWSKERKREFFNRNPRLFAYAVMDKINRMTRISDIKGEDFQIPLTVIPLTVEEQWALVLGK